jgi:BirA family biotin operon repressor/biotin-[acetyl-CoA-carboxylase] ligase
MISSFPGISQTLHLTRTQSTQTLARQLAEDGAPAGTLIWADAQTAGRGRMQRRWTSPLGGLYFSLILRPDFAPTRLADFSLAAGQAISQALTQLTKAAFAVKPPNDILGVKNGIPKKVCGILAEASGRSQKLDWLVVGIGVNVNAQPGLSSATSLKALTGRSWPLEKVLAAVLPALQAAAK